MTPILAHPLANRLPALGAVALLALGAAGLGSCTQHAQAANGDLQLTGSKYCAAFPTNVPTGASAISAVQSNPAGTFDDCIHRWGYTLAPARDPADVVAQATVDACAPILSAWSQQISGQDQGAGPSSRMSYRESQAQAQANPAQQQMRMAESRALFYVVQARAGGCAPPPANTLLASNTPAG